MLVPDLGYSIAVLANYDLHAASEVLFPTVQLVVQAPAA
jgi:hypothetical protein